MNRRDCLNRLATLPAMPAALAAFGAASPSAFAAEDAELKVSPEEAYQLASQGQGFSIGSPMMANPVRVFFDSTCPHCAHLWEQVQPLTRLKMVWMPVAFLRRQSLGQGAAILAAPDPVAAMREHEVRMRDKQGGIAIPTSLSAEALDKVKLNTQLLERLGANAVPLVIFRHLRNGRAFAFTGAASTAELSAIVGY